MAGPADQATTTIHDVQTELGKEGGSKQAAQILMKEIEDERKLIGAATNGITQDQFNAYVQSVMKGLNQELPALSVGWVANKSGDSVFSKTSIYGETGIVNKEQLQAYKDTNPTSPEGILAGKFLDQLTKIDGRNQYKEKDNEVSFAEVNQFISDNKDMVSNLAYAKMFATASGKILLDQLDTRGKGFFSGLVDDGNFDKDNLWQFINDAKSGNSDAAGTIRALALDSGMTEEQVTASLQRMYDNWDQPQFKLMRDGGIMNANSIAKGAGYDSLQACSDAGVCNVPEAIVPPATAADKINVQDPTKQPRVNDGANSIVLNSDSQPVRIDYKVGMPTKITHDPVSKAITNIVTGDDYTLAYDPVKQQWTESHMNTTTGKPDVLAITAPTLNETTGQIDYSYTGPNAAKIQYRPDGVRVKTDATGNAQVVAPTDATATAQVATLGGTYDTAATSFGEAATELATKKAGGALSDNAATRRQQIQDAKVDLLIKGYEQNVLKGAAPADDPVVKALNELRAYNGISEWVNYNGKKISIYQMLKGKINY